ncbi:MAG: OmpA family protein [Oscillospiraceae bacterium]|nr:OmpA family protein [Oscillospiraceae bacterium]
MAKMPPKKGNDNVGDWLNTYADMVTLLLTFFVLLFACSNLDETKMQYILQAFQSRGKYVNPYVSEHDPSAEANGGTTDNTTNIGGEGSMPQSFEELYQYLSDYIENNNLSDNVSVEQGAAHITIRFDDSVFFDGNSYILKPEGRAILDGISPGIKAIQQSIYTATISGHTSYTGLIRDSVINDWWLSSERALSVANYLNDRRHVTLDENKYRIHGAGYAEPIAPNDTLEGQQKNRRVEIMMLKNELDITDKDVIRDILEHDFGIGSNPFDIGNQKPVDISTLPDGSADKIIAIIDNKFKDNDVTSVGIIGPGIMNIDDFAPSAESGSDNGGGESE